MRSEVERLREALTRFRVLSNSLRTNLHDARTWHPENFNFDGVDELIRKWDESVRPIVGLEAALAASDMQPIPVLAGHAVETRKAIENELIFSALMPASDLRAKLEALRDELKERGAKEMTGRLTAILEGKA